MRNLLLLSLSLSLSLFLSLSLLNLIQLLSLSSFEPKEMREFQQLRKQFQGLSQHEVEQKIRDTITPPSTSSSTTPHTYHYTVIDRYPRDEYKDFPVDAGWATFAFPHGLTLSSCEKPPTFHFGIVVCCRIVPKHFFFPLFLTINSSYHL